MVLAVIDNLCQRINCGIYVSGNEILGFFILKANHHLLGFI